MKADVTTLDAKSAGTLELDESVFGLAPRADLMQRTVIWQLASRRSGDHRTQTRSEVTGTTKKMYRQKGTGGARHGNRKVPQFRGGGRAMGPVTRDHSIKLPKKVRALALKSALSAKQADGNLIVLDAAVMKEPKTSALAKILKKLGFTSALFIDGDAVDTNFARAAANIPGIDVLPSIGANVYDILRRDKLVLTKAAVEKLEARLK
jgi:large subunit ribosomal protein L4